MRRPAIFFDRDNTLILSDGYLGDPAKVELLPHAADAIARARAMGYATVTISNQSGVARGMFDEDAVHAVNAAMDMKLREANGAAIIDRHEFCPFHPEASVEQYRQDSDLRKPRPGMILSAERALALDLRRSWVIGDAPRDVEAGKAAGCRTILLKNPAVPASPAAETPSKVQPDHVALNLLEAIAIIQSHVEPAVAEKENGEETANQSVTTPDAPSPALPKATLPSPGRGEAAGRGEGSSTPSSGPSSSTIEQLAREILVEVRKRNFRDASDFSVTKLLAGITQVLVIAVLFLGYMRSDEPMRLMNTLLFALVLQALTIALLIMGRQR